MKIKSGKKKLQRQNKKSKKKYYGGNLIKPFRDNYDLKCAVFNYFDNFNLNKRAEVIKMYGNITNWNTTEITDMTEIFKDKRPILGVDNLIVLKWDTKNVTTMEKMFYGCKLNFKIEFTTTMNVENMSYMFYDATKFNEPLLESFNTNNVTNMSFMFCGASIYNQPLPISFKTNYVKNMRSMFQNAINYNHPIIFNTENIENVREMFDNAISFNQPININAIKIKSDYYLYGLFKNTFRLESIINIKLNNALANSMKHNINSINNLFSGSKLLSFPGNKPIINNNSIQFIDSNSMIYYLLFKKGETTDTNHAEYLIDGINEY